MKRKINVFFPVGQCLNEGLIETHSMYQGEKKKKEKAGLGSLFTSARVTLSPLACSSPGLNLYHHTESSRAQRRPRSRIPFTLMKRSSLTSVDSLNKWDPESPSPECHNSRRVENQLCLKRERGMNAFDTNNVSHRP